MTSNQERAQILAMIEAGTITPEEGQHLLAALGDVQEDATAHEVLDAVEIPKDGEPRLGEEETAPSPDPEGMRKWKRWWMIPLLIGAGVTVLSGFLMFSAWSSGAGFWFICSWVPFLLGTAVLALAWGSRTSPWLHLRVQQKPGQKPESIALSFPLPLRFAAWLLRTFGRFIPHMDATDLDEAIIALHESATEDTPLSINVDEGEGGERVEIFIE
ncbi:MAG: hypothetical protein MAG431_02546 [Chloroflexi bacterium]|nr:hypothetical protein [Chloroflexota bacterium]